jgi:hypothetical protein
MIPLQKLFTVTLNITNPIGFCIDTELHTMLELKRIYLGRCFKGSYINEILEIIRISDCSIISTNISGEGTIDVQFTANVFIFSAGDIVIAKIVSDAQQSMILGTYSRSDKPVAAVSILNAGVDITKGQMVPIIIRNAQHTPMETQANVVGSILMFTNEPYVHRIRADRPITYDSGFDVIIEEIDKELKIREEHVRDRKKDLWFFELLLCGYKDTAPITDQTIPGTIPWSGPNSRKNDGLPVINFLEIVRKREQLEGGIYTRSPSIYKSSPIMNHVVDASVLPPEVHIVENSARNVIMLYLKEMLNYLIATRELIETYNSMEMINTHKKIWSIMRNAQKSV